MSGGDGESVAVVVPARDAASTISACLGAITAELAPDDEVIVVDDASTDATAAVAERHGARVVHLAERGGPAAARNVGAAATEAPLLFFVDADVAVAPGALARVRHALGGEHLDAISGSYDDAPAARSTVSLFKNLAHHHVHHSAGGNATTFFAGCGAIRRTVFLAAGGFDAIRYPRPSIEDLELAARLAARGARLRLDPALQGKHLKRWTLGSLIATDVCRRAIPWTRLALEQGRLPATLNLATVERYAALVALSIAVLLPLSLFSPAGRVALAAALAIAVWLKHDLYELFARRGGATFAVGGFLLQQLYYVYSVAGFAIGAMLHFSSTLRRR